MVFLLAVTSLDGSVLDTFPDGLDDGADIEELVAVVESDDLDQVKQTVPVVLDKDELQGNERNEVQDEVPLEVVQVQLLGLGHSLLVFLIGVGHEEVDDDVQQNESLEGDLHHKHVLVVVVEKDVNAEGSQVDVEQGRD
jgi:hypothetical protein